MVSTLVVEWIEITLKIYSYATGFVSTLVVEWIEIFCRTDSKSITFRLHPRGGVD